MESAIPSVEKLQWQCRRGMLELDLIFKEFLDNRYSSLEDTDKLLFVELLKHSDQDLQSWIFSKTSPSNKNLLPILKCINKMH
mgnify:CR=1 FL=1